MKTVKLGIAKTRSGKKLIYVLKNQSCDFAYTLEELKETLRIELTSQRAICESKELYTLIMTESKI